MANSISGSATCHQDEVLHELKRSGLLPVESLAGRLHLSYTDSKQH
ncbi:MAG: hypothetical protein WCG66_00095 [bacterium]